MAAENAPDGLTPMRLTERVENAPLQELPDGGTLRVIAREVIIDPDCMVGETTIAWRTLPGRDPADGYFELSTLEGL